MRADLEAYPGIQGIPEGNLCAEPSVRPFFHSYLISFPDGMIA